MGARLVNAGGGEAADRHGYFIGNGIVIVLKDGVVKPGTPIELSAGNETKASWFVLYAAAFIVAARCA